jgi:hypothetical protein
LTLLVPLRHPGGLGRFNITAMNTLRFIAVSITVGGLLVSIGILLLDSAVNAGLISEWTYSLLKFFLLVASITLGIMAGFAAEGRFRNDLRK